MTVLTRPAFGLQTAYFGNALSSSATLPAQAPALPPAAQFSCQKDKVLFGERKKPTFLQTAASVGGLLLVLSPFATACSSSDGGSGSGIQAKGNNGNTTQVSNNVKACTSTTADKVDAKQAWAELSKHIGTDAANKIKTNGGDEYVAAALTLLPADLGQAIAQSNAPTHVDNSSKNAPAVNAGKVMTAFLKTVLGNQVYNTANGQALANNGGYDTYLKLVTGPDANKAAKGDFPDDYRVGVAKRITVNGGGVNAEYLGKYQKVITDFLSTWIVMGNDLTSITPVPNAQKPTILATCAVGK